MDEKQLQAALERLRQGDKTALEELFYELKTPVFTVILRITGERELSEDILQEFFLKLYRTPPAAHIAKPRAYLFRMARNMAVDGLKARGKELPLEEWMECPHSTDFVWRIELEDALSALPLMERQIVTLHLNGGLKFREIADILGQPLGTVLWRYRKAIGTLRDMLNGGQI